MNLFTKNTTSQARIGFLLVCGLFFVMMIYFTSYNQVAPHETVKRISILAAIKNPKLQDRSTTTKTIQIIEPMPKTWPVNNTLGRVIGENQSIEFQLTLEEDKLRQEWLVRNRSSCSPLNSSEWTFLNQTAFKQALQQQLDGTPAESDPYEVLASTKGLPPNEYLEAVEIILGDEVMRNLMPDGTHKPRDCEPAETLLIMVPYHDRAENLLYFLYYMHKFLQHQRRAYRIVLSEQWNDGKFRRANLFNALVSELSFTNASDFYECFVLSDVDKVPRNISLLYECDLHKPRQMCRTLYTADNLLKDRYYPGFFGGVSMMSRWTYFKLNGMSNAFAGWGGEDDDFRARTWLTGIGVIDANLDEAKFVSLEHRNDMSLDEKRYEKIEENFIFKNLISNGLYQVEYELTESTEHHLFSVYTFDIL